MNDKEIIELYRARSETAISATADKYGRYLSHIAYNILRNNEDCEECLNDTYLKTWESIPPNNPDILSAFLGKITRNLALNRLEHYNAKKRGASHRITLALEELANSLPSVDNVTQSIDEMALTEILNNFLEALPLETRKIFVRRYWYLSSIREIASEYRLSESKVKMSLLRSRNKLKQILEKEGIL